MSLPVSLIELIERLRVLPGIGEKSAQRLAYHILRADKEYVSGLAAALVGASEKIVECGMCRLFSEKDPCDICTSPMRSNTICIVEKPTDAQAIEATGEFKGRYFVLHGALSPIDGINPEDLGLDLLIHRVKEEQVDEIIIATNSSTEGDATAYYIAQIFADINVKLTKIAYGLPVGGMIEYADRQTLEKALENRTPL